ncbi:MAG: U32 family peptidase [Sphingobium sp.]|nr:U32 family peptidase [Sphingobium sp.]MCI1272013.1 U32 family peptidase [Sphingobium sp.]MCI1755859.1 U32 family peptidase [Sphingobium sp.]MCI2052224.1 U32 family peptidase [Sphingobium sp.]
MTKKLTLGAIPFHWDADRKRDFYARIADEAPIDMVYLGEVVCSKRSPFFERHYPDVIERLERGGKRVVLSTLSEVVLPRERRATTELCGQTDYPVEVNNAAGLSAVDGRPHYIGPMMNVYNERTLAHLARHGAMHFTLPVELPQTAATALARAAADLGVMVEVQVFGRASLALSARCYHARAHRRSKDECQFVCQEDPDGMTLQTLGGDNMLAINGIQTLSHSYVNLLAEIGDMHTSGISHFRLMPHSTDMIAVAAIFADRLAGRTDAAEAGAQLDALNVGAPFSNGFWHGVAGHRYLQGSAFA